ncbi:MAG: ATP-binding protein [Bacilli bacterium]|nr:ATP-binding protein [Bacilli bacterium]
MKKKNNFAKDFIKRQYGELILFNLIAFFAIFTLLGVLAISSINNTFFNDIKKDILAAEENIKDSLEYSAESDRLIVANNNNVRIMMIFYTNDEVFRYYSSNLLSYVIHDYDRFSRINEGLLGPWDSFDQELWDEYISAIATAEQNSIFNIDVNNLDHFVEFETVTTGTQEYTFMTRGFSMFNEDVPLVKYAKVLVMVNGEVNSRDQIVKIYIISAILMILAGAVASIILSITAMRPIIETLNKQIAFVSDASHELRTPLAIVQSKLENTLTKSNLTVYDVSEDIAISLKEVARLNKLTTDLLQLAKSDNYRDLIQLENVNLTEVVKETSEIFKETAELQRKGFVLKLEEVSALVDRNKMTQLLIIILDNALRYTNEKDKITITLTLINNDVHLEIADTGIGISEETKKHIFERFYREDKARSRETGGNGLGLAIAKTIVEAHMGKIQVEHNEPKGTKFIIVIPKRLRNQ